VKARRATPSRRTRGAGFTLLELAVVVAVMSVLAVFAAPAAWWIAAARSGGAARVLLQDIAYARETAMHSGTTCWVAVDLATSSYRLLADDPDNPGRAGAHPLVDPATGADYQQQFGSGEFVGVGIETAAFDGHTEVGFDWLGRPLRPSGIRLAARGEVALSDGFRCILEPGTGAAWIINP
jgi:prepilin-type N-terminal cleavage/methylation domain-containing protein